VADLEKTVQIIFEAIDNMTDPIGEMGDALSGFGGKAGDAAEKADVLSDSVETIPADLELNITLEDNATDGINNIQTGISDIPEEKEFAVDCDPSPIVEVSGLIDDMPAEHELDIYLAGDPYSIISDIGEGIDELPESVELDIGVEAGDYAGIFSDFSESVDNTRQEIEDLFAAEPWALKEFEAEAWRTAIDEDMALKNEEFEAQKKLIEQQLEILEMKKSLLESGTALISIDTTGVEPILEDLLMSLCEKLQVRISENLPAFLVGIT
jgi:hypothetical protein